MEDLSLHERLGLVGAYRREENMQNGLKIVSVSVI
jgi:hypothetical protein